MAFWDKKKRDPSQIHGGLEYKQNDNISIDQINAVVNNSFYATDRSDYAVDLSTALADPPDNTDVDKVGTPKVELIDNEKNGKVLKKFKFSNLKGEKGDKGNTGNDGASVWVRYSANADGTGMTETPEEGTRYVGFFQGDAPSGDIANYTWSLYRGKGFSNVTIEGSSFKISYDDGTKETVPIDTTNCLATEGVSIEENLVHPATLIPNGTNIDTYIGSEYWGRCFYAGGSNTVTGVPDGREGHAFYLEVIRGGGSRTIQVYRDAREELVRYIDAENMSAWRLIAGANGSYPAMEVGEAQRLVMRANVSGAGQLGWYKLGTVTVERLKTIQNTSASYSLFMLVNGSNPPGTNNSAARSGIIEIDTAVGSGGQLQLGNGYTSIKALCGNLDVNDFAVVIDSAGTTLTVYMDARENGVGTRTAFSVISEVYGAISGSAFEFGWEFYGAAAPADAQFATVQNNASGAEYLSKRHRLQTDSVQKGWLKIGTVLMSGVENCRCYNCIMIISGVYRETGAASTAPKTAIVEIESRKYASSLGHTGIGILAGDIPADRLCFAEEDNLDISLYIYNDYTENIDIQFEILSEELSNKTPANIFEFSADDTALASAPSGAVYAVVRNVASRAEALALKNIFSGTLSYGYSVTLPIAVDFKNDEAIFDVYFQINGDSGYKGSVTTKNACMITEEATGETVIVVRAMVCPSEGFNAVVRNIDIRLVYNSSSRELTYDTFSVWSVGASGQISTANTNTIVNITGIRIKKAAL